MVYCCFLACHFNPPFVGGGEAGRGKYTAPAGHKSMRTSRAVRFLFSSASMYASSLSVAVADGSAGNTDVIQNRLLPINISRCFAMQSPSIRVVVSRKTVATSPSSVLRSFALLRYVSAENTGVPINLPVLFHRLPFCLPLEAVFISAVPLSNPHDRPRHDRGRFSLPELLAALAVDVRRHGCSVALRCIVRHLLHSTAKAHSAAHKITAVIEIHAHR